MLRFLVSGPGMEGLRRVEGGSLGREWEGALRRYWVERERGEALREVGAELGRRGYGELVWLGERDGGSRPFSRSVSLSSDSEDWGEYEEVEDEEEDGGEEEMFKRGGEAGPIEGKQAYGLEGERRDSGGSMEVEGGDDTEIMDEEEQITEGFGKSVNRQYIQ